MNNRRHKVFAAGLAALSVPAVIGLSSPPAAESATALFAEGLGQKAGKAQTAFNGAFCEQNTCRSIGTGPYTPAASSRQIQGAVTATPGDIILVGYSLGAAGVYDRLRVWARDPSLAPDPKRVVLIVTFGNPENKYGGANRNQPGAGLPAVQPYPHLNVTSQYDPTADAPTRWGFYSAMNLYSSAHFAYFEDMDINDPDNLVFQEGNTTYMLVPTDVLPMLQWRAWFTSPEEMARLDAKYRPLVERDYDRPAYIPQGEGADWGNGTPPPSLSGAGTQVVAQQTVDAASTTTLDLPDDVSNNDAAARSSAPLSVVEESGDNGTDEATDTLPLSDDENDTAIDEVPDEESTTEAEQESETTTVDAGDDGDDGDSEQSDDSGDTGSESADAA